MMDPDEPAYEGSGPILFLDLKGTMSIGPDSEKEFFVGTHTCFLALATLLKNVPGLAIVITSDARFDRRTVSRFGSFLREYGMPRSVVAGVTPSVRNGRRGDEIAAWIAQHPKVTRHVVIDDSNVSSSVGAKLGPVIYVVSTVGLDSPAAAEAATILRA